MTIEQAKRAGELVIELERTTAEADRAIFEARVAVAKYIQFLQDQITATQERMLK